MKNIILSATALSGLLLAGCIPLDNKKVGLAFNFENEAEQVLADVSADELEAIEADEGASYKSNFKAESAKFSAAKSTNLTFAGVEIKSKVTAISNGTSRIKSGDVWDRVQNHPITVEMDVDVTMEVDLTKLDDLEADDAKINKANLSIQGEFGTDMVADFKSYESDAENALKDSLVGSLESSDFVPNSGSIGAVISDGTLSAYATNILTPFEEFVDEELYGAYRNGNQYTAFYAAGSNATEADQVKDIATTSKYDVNFRGVANWDGTSYNKLGGTGSLNVNFNAGTYTGDITVKDGSLAIGEINFDGSSSNTVSFSDNAATFTPTEQASVTGYVDGSAYGKDADTFMGTADFADGPDVLVGAFNATPKVEVQEQ